VHLFILILLRTGILHRGPDSAINLRIVIVADAVFLLFLDAFSKVPDTYVEQTAFGAAGKAIHILQRSVED
jgi:hypothetical protein